VAVHRHRSGYRGSVSVTTATYPTEAEAQAALAELKTRLAQLKGSSPARDSPGHETPHLDLWRPACDYPRSEAR
jgi:hypothetical protein